MELVAVITAKGPVFEAKTAEIVSQELSAAMTEATMYLEREVKANTPQGVFGAQGGLLSTIKGEVVGKGTPVIMGIVATSSPYGEVIEKGRTAGKPMPPAGTLIRWIEKKMGLSELEAQEIEFLVRRKIARKGFPGAHMFERAFERSWQKMIEIFDRCGFNVARRLDGR